SRTANRPTRADRSLVPHLPHEVRRAAQAARFFCCRPGGPPRRRGPLLAPATKRRSPWLLHLRSQWTPAPSASTWTVHRAARAASKMPRLPRSAGARLSWTDDRSALPGGIDPDARARRHAPGRRARRRREPARAPAPARAARAWLLADRRRHCRRALPQAAAAT